MSEYFDQIHEGLPITDIEIIDVHAHLGVTLGFHEPLSTPDEMVWMMDRCGIDKTIISSTVGIYSDLVLGNNLMLEAVRAHRGRLYGACYVNGNYPELSLDELHRCFEADPGVLIMKIHPLVAQCRMNDRRMKKLYEFASERKLFTVVHTWIDQDPYGNQDLFASVVKNYPDIAWLMGHSGGPHGLYHALEIARDNPNVYLDITRSMYPARELEVFVDEIGSERVMFGTDNPFIDPRPFIGRVGLADISRKDRENIFYRNARRLIAFGDE